jgi:hypothetical protein
MNYSRIAFTLAAIFVLIGNATCMPSTSRMISSDAILSSAISHSPVMNMAISENVSENTFSGRDYPDLGNEAPPHPSHRSPIEDMVVSLPSAEAIGSMTNAASVAAFLQDYISWCKDNPEADLLIHDVQIFAVSNSQDNTVGYIEGVLSYDDQEEAFKGTGKQYFNDRMWNLDTLTNPYQKAPPMIVYPFDPTRTDEISLRLQVGTGALTIVHLGWGGVEEVALRLEGETLYGFSNIGASGMFIISLKEHKTPIK